MMQKFIRNALFKANDFTYRNTGMHVGQFLTDCSLSIQVYYKQQSPHFFRYLGNLGQ